MAWEDNFNPLIVKNIPIDDSREWRFVLEEHKTRGTMQINVRLWRISNKEGGYEGPTKNGFICKIQTEDDLNNLRDVFTNQFNEFFNEVKEML